MHTLYNFAMYLVKGVLPLVALFSSKLRLFVSGRKRVYDELSKLSGAPVIWLHAASLGEYEQGVPVIEQLQKAYPKYEWVITFFSPSGYEVKKDNAFAKACTYLPLDTPAAAQKFVQTVNPALAIFVKYEFWPNYLNALKANHIPTLLLSGVFRKSQPFFKSFGQWMVPSLEAFDYFFVQEKDSQILAEHLGFSNITVSGDTRFDRVSRQIEMDNTLDFVQVFKGDSTLLVCGSTWPACDEVLIPFINERVAKSEKAFKCIIAPHQIKAEKIEQLSKRIQGTVVKYSAMTPNNLATADVLIVDTVGLLTKIYSYADLAYVGGAIGDTGLHNILEPATFGIPILIGPHFDKFPEAQRLRQLAGLYVIENTSDLKEIGDKLLDDKPFRKQTGMIAGHFINSNTGATRTVMQYIKDQQLLTP